MLGKIAWKNVWRSKERSLILIAAIGSGLFGGLLAMSVMFGLSRGTIKNAIETVYSHVQIHAKGYAEEPDVNGTIPHSLKLLEDLKKTTGFTVCGRLKVSGMASSAQNSSGVWVYGIDPSEEKQVTTVSTFIRKGDYFEDSTKLPVVVGEKLAKKLGVKLKSKIVLTFQNSEGSITSGAFRITGIFKTNSSMFDESQVFVKRDSLAVLLGVSEFHEIALRFQDEAGIEAKVEKLRSQYHELDPVLDIAAWYDLAPQLDYMSRNMRIIFSIFMGIILLALGFGMVNTMLMVVLERGHELGVLMAIGMKKTYIFWMLVFETVFLSLSGAALGMALAAVGIRYYQNHGINLALFSEGLSRFGISEKVFPVLPLSLYPGLAFLIVLTAILASIYPALKVLKQNPAEALASV